MMSIYLFARVPYQTKSGSSVHFKQPQHVILGGVVPLGQTNSGFHKHVTLIDIENLPFASRLLTLIGLLGGCLPLRLLLLFAKIL